MTLKQGLRDKNHTGKDKMIIPMRCFSCNKPVAHLWEKYNELIKSGKSPKEALDEIGLTRYCCRALFLGHVDLLDEVAQFKKA